MCLIWTAWKDFYIVYRQHPKRAVKRYGLNTGNASAVFNAKHNSNDRKADCMDTLVNAVLGLVFFGLALVGTFLMFKLWGYPFDHNTLKSEAPRSLMMLHRVIGYAYFAIYLYLMSQMVPRIWSYQIELPARTVAHMCLGFAIGAILIVKISVVRFFKHLESQMVPLLGTALFICTALLIGLSVPFTLRASYASHGSSGTAFSQEGIDRVKRLLPAAGFPKEVRPDQLATERNLRAGRIVLLSKCVQCHDLRTVLVRPRTPEDWVRTVHRMADRAVFEPISDGEERNVAMYLIMVSPDLQKSAQERRDQQISDQKSKEGSELALNAMTLPESATATMDLAKARKVFEATCSQCHKSEAIEKSPPATADDARHLLARMINNGLKASQEDLQQTLFYIIKTYPK
jgi:mono/diheme cytochrome c family protein